MDGPVVKVLEGSLQGKIAKTCHGKEYYSFEGIPYAEPPVGELRFRDTVPIKSWEGIRNATKPGPRCAQRNPYIPSEFTGSEDCLYLNVYTPILPRDQLTSLPVMFFIHGGRFLFGFGDYYRPDYFIERDVILVTLNYRLHVLGFLALDTPEVPGNAGFKDIAVALKWVNKNISVFSGDSNNVTVFGESAGSGAASVLLCSDMCKGYFSKMIGESGSCLSDLFMIESDDYMAKAIKLSHHLRKPTDKIDELYRLLQDAPVEKLVDAVCEEELAKKEIACYFNPVPEKIFDGVEPFLTDYPLNIFKKNSFINVPVLCGYNIYDGALFLPRDPDGEIIYEKDLTFYLPKYLPINVNSKKADKFAKGLKKLYFGEKDIDDNTRLNYVKMITDAYFIFDMYRLANFICKVQKDVWMYRFAYSGGLNTRVGPMLGLSGASHGDILPYQFYRANKADNVTEDDRKVIDFIMETWTNFAKNGKPTWEKEKMGWLRYNPTDRYCVNIDGEITLGVFCERKRMNYWESFINEHSKL